MSTSRSPLGPLRDRPRGGSLLLISLVIGQVFLARRESWLDLPGRLLPGATAGELEVICLGGASLAAVIGGFAGVVVVFGVGTDNGRFRLLRHRGGRPLAANWTSVVADCLGSAFLSLSAALLLAAEEGRTGLWFFEVALLLALHGSLRLLWLLASLVRVVGAEDADSLDPAEPRIPSSSVVQPLPTRKGHG